MRASPTTRRWFESLNKKKQQPKLLLNGALDWIRKERSDGIASTKRSAVANRERMRASPTTRRWFESLKKKSNNRSCCLMAHSIGFEPTTPGVGGLCSIQLSYGCMSEIIISNICPFAQQIERFIAIICR